MRVVLTAAVMDLCHEGHIRLLKEMRANGDIVVVVLHDDKSVYEIKGKIPVQDVLHRMNNLHITGLVDRVLVTMNVDPADKFQEVISTYGEKNILFMRADDNKNFPGKWIIENYNIPIKYVKYTKGVSSSLIRKKLCK
jgi:cytidyltransferase-like protein